MTVTAPTDVVQRFWRALGDRDWDAVGSFFADGSEYWDIPIGRENGATGAANIVARLRLGIEPLEAYANHDERTVTEGDTVVSIHSETWTWDGDHSVRLPFVSYQRVDGDVIVEWRDYWDVGTLMNAAPAWWHEHLANADLSWRSDAAPSRRCRSGRRRGR